MTTLLLATGISTVALILIALSVRHGSTYRDRIKDAQALGQLDGLLGIHARIGPDDMGEWPADLKVEVRSTMVYLQPDEYGGGYKVVESGLDLPGLDMVPDEEADE